MKITHILIFALLLSLNAYAQLTVEDLSQTLFDQSEYGPIETTDLHAMNSLLEEVGEQELIQKSLEALNFENLDQLSLVVQVCESDQDHVLGTYQRGKIMTYKKIKQTFDNVYTSEWGEEILNQLEEAYKYTYVENEVFYSLVVESWPTICMKKSQDLVNGTLTFVHELIHYLNDDKSKIDLLEFPLVDNYVESTLMSAGGEYEAYFGEALVAKKINEHFDILSLPRLMRSYEDKEKLMSYILDDLGYRTKFESEYQNEVLNFHENAIYHRDYLNRIYEVYLENQKIFESNLENTLIDRKRIENNEKIHLNNIKIIKQSIQYGWQYTQSDLDNENSLLAQNKESMVKNLEREKVHLEKISFYQKMHKATFETLENQLNLIKKYQALFIEEDTVPLEEDDSITTSEETETDFEQPIHPAENGPTSEESLDHQTENDLLQLDQNDNESELIEHP